MWCFNIITRISLHLHWWFLFEFLTIQPRIRYYNLLHAGPKTLVSCATSRVARSSCRPLNSLEQSRISRFLVLMISRQENVAVAGGFGDIFFDGILTFGFLEECPRGSFPGTRRLRGKCWSKPQHSQGLEVNSFFGLKIQSLIGANSDFFRHNNSVARTKEIHYEIERNPFHRSNRLSWIHLSRRRPSLQVRLPVKCSGEGHVVEGSLKNIRIRKHICVSSDFQPGQRPCQSRAASSGYSTPPGLEAAPWKVKDKQPVSSSAWLECVPPVQSSIHSHGILCG